MSRSSKEYKKFVKEVLERDGHKCTYCQKTENLEVHHIKPYEKYPALRTNSDNGMTLCRECHDNIHGKGRYKAFNFSESGINQVVNFLKFGCDLRTALLAVESTENEVDDILKNIDFPPDDYWSDIRAKIVKASAQARVIFCQKIFTEGGMSGAKYLLERMEQKPKSKPVKQIEKKRTGEKPQIDWWETK